MAGYDIFTNIQGPAVPVSLYGDAATAGINAGNALPTTTTALIQGGLKGLQQGQEIVATQQQNEIRANQIEQLPIQNQRQQAALDADLTANRINEVRANIAATNQTAAQEEQLSQLNYQKEAYDAKLKASTDLANYTKTISGMDPTAFKDSVLSGQFDSVYADNPKAYEKALKDLYLNQTKNGLAQDPITLGAVGTLLKKSSAISSIDKLAEQNRQAAAQNEALVTQSSLTDLLSSKLDGDPREFPSQVKIAQQGKYILDPNTHAIMRTNDGQYVENTPANRALYKSSDAPYEPKNQSFFAYSPTTGEILADNVSPDDAKLYSASVKFKRLMSGETARATAESIGSDFRNALGKAREAATPGQPSQAPGYDAIAEKTLGVTPDVVAKIKPSLTQLDKEASVYVSSPEARNSPGAISSRSSVITNTAKAIAAHSFETNPDLKNTYNDDAVANWNKGVDAEIESKSKNSPGLSPFSGFSLNIGLGKGRPSILNPLPSDLLDISIERNYVTDALRASRVSTPFDLYYRNQAPSLEKSVQDLFKKLVDARSLVADKSSNNIKASATTASYLASIPRRAQ